MKNKLLIASGNKNKAKEIQSVGADFNLQFVLPGEINSQVPEIEENGSDFFSNALIKARAYHQWSSLPVLADDSGLEVEILGNLPGIYSARYGGSISQLEKNEMLIREVLESEKKLGKKNRKANFCCCLILYFSENKYFHQTERLWGEILDSPRGGGGFGYDPILKIDSLGKTLAEIDFNITTSIGFRAIALRKLLNGLDPTLWLVP